MVAGYLLHPGERANDLSLLAGGQLGESRNVLPTLEEGRRQVAAAATPGTGTAPARAAEVIWRLLPGLRKQLREAGHEHLFESLERPLITILADMEARGILVAPARLKMLAEELQHAMERKAATIFDLAKEEFNIQAPRQLASILFEKLGLPVAKKTKSGPSTDMAVLEEQAQRVRRVLAEVPGATEPQIEQVAGLPVLQVRARRDALARYQVNVAQVLEVVETASGGKEASEFVAGQRRWPIVVRLGEAYRSTPEDIGSILVEAGDGSQVALAGVCDIWLLYTSPSPRDRTRSRMPSSA